MKRKAEGPVPIDEVVVNKKVKVEGAISEEESESAGDDDDEEEEEEEWQREAAQQLATEAEEERKRAEERQKVEELEARRSREVADIAVPQRVDLSIEEGKALFKVSIMRLEALQLLMVTADITQREGHQSITSLGHVPS